MAAAATTSAVATDRSSSPPRNMKSEYSFVRHTSSTTTTRPARPATSSSRRDPAESVRAPRLVGYTIATAAPISSPNARVSVPS